MEGSVFANVVVYLSLAIIVTVLAMWIYRCMKDAAAERKTRSADDFGIDATSSADKPRPG